MKMKVLQVVKNRHHEQWQMHLCRVKAKQSKQ